MNRRPRKSRCCCKLFRSRSNPIYPDLVYTEEHFQRDIQIENDEEIARQIQNDLFSGQHFANSEEFEPIVAIKIDTCVSVNDIKSIDTTPFSEDELLLYKYNCPICLRYFNRILHGKCCGNYICYFCACDFNNTIKKLKLRSIRCPLCNHDGLSLFDVNLEDEVKTYDNTLRKPKELSVLESKNSQSLQDQSNSEQYVESSLIFKDQETKHIKVKEQHPCNEQIQNEESKISISDNNLSREQSMHRRDGFQTLVDTSPNKEHNNSIINFQNREECKDGYFNSRIVKPAAKSIALQSNGEINHRNRLYMSQEY